MIISGLWTTSGRSRTPLYSTNHHNLAANMRTQLLALLSLITLPSLSHASTADQFVIPNSNAKMAHQPEIQIQTHTQPSLADLLTIEPTASIFYSYARELEISSQFSETKQTKWTILVPTNKAVMALSRKPYVQAPRDTHNRG